MLLVPCYFTQRSLFRVPPSNSEILRQLLSLAQKTVAVGRERLRADRCWDSS